MSVPDDRHRSKIFKTTCPGVNIVASDNVMVVSVCSSYMFSIRLGNIPRCSTSCKVAEGLFNLWSSSSGQGSSMRIPPALSFVDALATDACQLDDFMESSPWLLQKLGCKRKFTQVTSASMRSTSSFLASTTHSTLLCTRSTAEWGFPCTSMTRESYMTL